MPDPEPTGRPAHEAVAASASPEGSRPLDVGVLAHILFHTAGVVRTVRTFGEIYHFRTYACAGALYPVEAYVVAGEVGGLEPGVYHYGPVDHALRRLRAGDHRGNLGLAGEAPGTATIVLSGIPWRTAWKYAARGFRHLYWDSGMMLANLLAAAAALDVRARVALGFVDASADELIAVDGRAEFALCMVPLGEGGAPPPVAMEPISPRTATLSARPMSDPLIEEAREAMRLSSEDDVRIFRTEARVAPDRTGPSSGPEPLPPARLSRDGLEEVIRRRGSSRRLAREPIPAAEYAAIMQAALAGLPADWPGGGVVPHVVGNALEGLIPGAFRYDAGFRPVRQGPFRSDAGFLCLEQRLGADAAATTFLMVDVDRYVAALGARGYAAAQLEAAVIAGRMYLGAYAQCLGASGITFYDDEARRFFETDLEPMLAVVMGPEGHRRSIRRCRQGRDPG